MRAKILRAFADRFTSEPAYIVRAPGRVNLIGEHTDYNDGFVLPMAIDRAIWIALRPRQDRNVSLVSLNFDEEVIIDLDAFQKGEPSWFEYVKAMAWALSEFGQDKYPLSGWEGVISGDVPIGAGLSSSAAVEIAIACAFSAVGGWQLDTIALAKVAQRAENAWVGVNSGIMDQMIVAGGQSGHALLIDCRYLTETQPVPLPTEATFVILDTNTRRGLVESAYNERREQCQIAADQFKVLALRDVDKETFNAHAQELDPVIRMRARHVISENERTLQAANAMRANDAVTLGKLMGESHASLRDDFEVSSPELNAMVECALSDSNALGARLTGAGFAGCAIALVNNAAIERFVSTTTHCYHQCTGLQPNIYVTRATAGASVEKIH